MKGVLVIGLILLVGLSFTGCATVDHSVLIDTDKTNANASGQYRDNRFGQMGGWGFWILGGYSGDNNPSSPWRAKQGDSDPVKFARAVAILNYSKRLRNITYNEAGEVVGYEFDSPSSTGKSRSQQIQSQTSLPESFGHQPIQ
jgi:hypothetical protein